MIDYDIDKAREMVARLFVVAINNKINFKSFTNMLIKSKFIYDIENNLYNDYLDKPIEELFYVITGFRINEDNSYGIYNDAYWSGQMYFDLHMRTNKPFSYIMLKLPLAKIMEIHTIFHEMDFTSLAEYFQKIEQEKTILRLLCESNKCSLSTLSKILGISKATLIKYNDSDEALYNASFQNIVKIMKHFDTPLSLFIK